MVVEDVEQHVRLVRLQPRTDRLEALEDRRPGGFLLFVVIDGKADGRGVGDGQATNDASHVKVLCFS